MNYQFVALIDSGCHQKNTQHSKFRLKFIMANKLNVFLTIMSQNAIRRFKMKKMIEIALLSDGLLKTKSFIDFGIVAL